MSGYKCATVTIRRDEYEQLLEKDKKLRDRQNKQKLNKQQTQNLLLAYQDLEDRQEEYERFLQNKMGNEIASIEKDISRNLLRNQAEYYQELVDQIREAEDEQAATQQLLLETTRNFEETLREERWKDQEILEEMACSLSAITEDRAGKEDLTRQWLSDCMQLSGFIQDHYDHEKFCPGENNAVVKRLNLALENSQAGMFDTGLQFAQEAYLKLSELRLRLEEKTGEWQALFQIADEELRNISEEIAATNSVPALGLDGEYLDLDLDLEKRSEGKYTKLLTISKDVRTELHDKAQGFELQDLEYISSKVVPKMRQEFENLIYEVRQEALNVQIKNNIGYLAMKSLEDHGYSFDQAWYANNDEGDAFLVSMDGIDGSHISLQVAPSRDTQNANRLSVESYDSHINTEHELMTRWGNIERALQKVGAHVGDLEVEKTTSANDDKLVIEPERAKAKLGERRSSYYVH